ncbi:MAG: DUF1015 domain-containing protein [Deltaproteobacteria bacterium]|nr:DUF1015 domain-containing protein [Deltaproteobacteria bacterium]
MRTYPSAGMAIPEVLLPNSRVDPTRWAVVACDQYTSQPEYWDAARKLAGDSPSTLNLIYPEVYLSEPDPDKRIASIREHMEKYLKEGVFESHDGMIYVERQAAGRTRKGLVTCIDLEKYDYNKGSTTLVRATEGTILERIPPRVRIRKGAPLELPHILILIDDPDDTVIGAVSRHKATLRKLYDFELMQKSGHLCGYLVNDQQMEKEVAGALDKLASPEAYCKRYGLPSGTPVLLFAVGDGNHSLATAKAIWEDKKKDGAPMDSLARWAMVELVNLHDTALVFEPIHRVLFHIAEGRDLIKEMIAHYPGKTITTTAVASTEEMKKLVTTPVKGVHRIGMITDKGRSVIEVKEPSANLAVATLQQFLDPFVKSKGAAEIDYVHGTEPVDTLGRKPGNVGLFLPAMDKYDLFKSVILDGVLPRKTFSMGEAEEKRFYMECRKL